MSVLKSHRSISPVEFLENAIELEKYTHAQCKKFPKSERFFLAMPIFNLSHVIVYHVKSANEIVPRDQHEVQRRRDHFQDAKNALSDMVTQLDLAKNSITGIPDHVWVNWMAMIAKEKTLIIGIMKSDLKRYSNLV